MGEDDGEDAGEGRARGRTRDGVVVDEAGEVSDREAVEIRSGSARVFAWLGRGEDDTEEIRSARRRQSVIGWGCPLEEGCMYTYDRSIRIHSCAQSSTTPASNSLLFSSLATRASEVNACRSSLPDALKTSASGPSPGVRLLVLSNRRIGRMIDGWRSRWSGIDLMSWDVKYTTQASVVRRFIVSRVKVKRVEGLEAHL